MKTSFVKKGMKAGFISSLLAGMLCSSANASLYQFNYTDSGAIPQGGTVFSAEHIIGSISIPDPTITRVELILTFNNSASLNPSTILGRLNLGTDPSSPYVRLAP